MSRSTTNSKVKLPMAATATHVVAAQMSPGKVPFRDENAEEMKRSARGKLVKTSSLFVQVIVVMMMIIMMMMTIDDDDDVEHCSIPP